ncbi:ubiquitin-binding protein cue5 [Ciborinia camelliae]|nr:ubiquitin-binding protein cue5 [Ciborinia camelliae]
MSAPAKSSESPTRSPPPESPTTVAPFDMDDDDVQESTTGADVPTLNKTADELPPAKPPRPLSPQQQAENTLKEAFPSIDTAIVKAVLIASGGRVEPAFNALLGMSDPDAAIEVPPPQPPRPQAQRVGSTPRSQLESDEQYARQLAEHYEGSSSSYGPHGPRGGSRGAYAQGRKQTGLKPNGMYGEEEEHSFLDDDLPVIKENLRKGFLETQSKVNGWITNLKKKLDGEDTEEGPSTQGYHSSQNTQYRTRRSGEGKQSGDYNRYDSDPQVLGDDFAGIQLNEDGSRHEGNTSRASYAANAYDSSTPPARRSTRPLANPDLFKPTPGVPKAEGRKVSFQNATVEDDLYRTSPKLSGKENTPSTKQSKWQPLNSMEPSPIGDADNDHDPFSLGDSEDERESKDRVGGKEIRSDDAERLKKAAAEAMSENIGEPAKKPEPAETSGTKD